MSAASSWVRWPPRDSVNVAIAFGPASASATCPAWSNATANGTSPGRELTVGDAESRPSARTENTSTSFVEPFVVTSSCDPSGVNATCPGVAVNCDAAVVPRLSARFEPGIGARYPPAIRYPESDPPPSAFRT